MKNKHGLHSASHNPEVFRLFCDLASEFELEDLMQVMVERYWDNSNLRELSGTMEDVIDERRGPNNYKLRAECLNDIWNLFSLIDVESYTIENIGFSDALLSFSCKDDWFHIDHMLDRVNDSHVMRETLAYADDYTGDRDATYSYRESDDPHVYDQSLNMYRVMSLISDFNKNFRTNYTSIKSFNEGEEVRSLEKNIDNKIYNGDLRFDIGKIKGLDQPVTISKGHDHNLDSPYAIDVRDTSYWYAEEEDRDSDFDKLRSIVFENQIN
jgi:hypothetical protein